MIINCKFSHKNIEAYIQYDRMNLQDSHWGTERK